jgi:hypothetical protein
MRVRDRRGGNERDGTGVRKLIKTSKKKYGGNHAAAGAAPAAARSAASRARWAA